MDKVISIIRLSKEWPSQAQDLARFSDYGFTDLQFMIPVVRVFKGKLRNEVFFEDKPLLLSYGFLSMPIALARNREGLKILSQASQVIQGFFYRAKEDIEKEMEKKSEAVEIAKEKGVPSPDLFLVPILVKSVKPSTVEGLFERAKSLESYHTTEPLGVGTYIILQSYPFEGLAALVLEKRNKGRVKLELLDSGVVITKNVEDLVYTFEDSPFYT